MKKPKAVALKAKLKSKLKAIRVSHVHSVLQTVLLVYLVIRVNGLYKEVHKIEAHLREVSYLFHDITEALSDQIANAQVQFQMAIESILSLFGGREG